MDHFQTNDQQDKAIWTGGRVDMPDMQTCRHGSRMADGRWQMAEWQDGRAIERQWLTQHPLTPALSDHPPL